MKSQVKLGMVCLLFASVFVAPQVAQAQCSNATLTGNWGFLFTGKANGATGADVGLFTFDGSGTFTLKDTLSTSAPAIIRWEQSQGEYWVNSNCTGEIITHTNSVVVHFAITVDPVGLTFKLACTDQDAETWDPTHNVFKSTLTGNAAAE